VIAHAMDRVFGFARVPAVVPRFVDAFKLKYDSRFEKNLQDDKHYCQNGITPFYGSVMAWSKYPVAVQHDYWRKFLDATRFDLTDITQHQLEFVRLVMMLFLGGAAAKMNHNIYMFVSTIDVTARKMFVIGVDNDRFAWKTPLTAEHVC
jgi:hypothetical protein